MARGWLHGPSHTRLAARLRQRERKWPPGHSGAPPLNARETEAVMASRLGCAAMFQYIFLLFLHLQWIQESVIPGLHALIFRDTAHAPLALPVPPVPLMSAAHSASGGDSDIEHEVLAIGRSRPGCAGQENEFLVLWGDKTCTWEPYKNGARLPVQAVEQALGHPRCTSCSDGR